MPGQDYSSTFAPITSANPLQQAGGVAGLQNQLLANQAQQQEFKARQAAGPVLQAAVDPQTGILDPNKAFVGFASHPDLAWKAQDLLKTLTDNGLTTANTAKIKAETAQKQQEAIANLATSLKLSGKAGDPDSVQKAITDAHARSPDLFPMDRVIAVKQQVMGMQPGAQLEHWVGMIGQSATSANENLTRTLGNWEQQTAPTTVYDESGQPRMTTRAGFAGMQPGAGGGQVAPLSPAGSGGGGVSPVAPTSGPQGLPSGGPGPQQKARIEQNAQNYKQDFETYGRLSQSDAGMEQSLDRLEATMQHFTPGPGQEKWRQLAQAAKAVGLSPETVQQLAGGDKLGLSENQVYKSLATDLATKMMARTLAGGGRFTNTEFNTYQDVKPNENITKEAVQQMFQHYRNGIAMDRKYMEHMADAEDNGVPFASAVAQFNNAAGQLSERRRQWYKSNPDAIKNEPGIHPGWEAK